MSQTQTKDIQDLLDSLELCLLGKRKQLEYAVACLFSGGHLLIEDVPGVGKTTLARSLAESLEAEFKRVQFTSDLLPGDLIGVTVFHQKRGEFEFQPGPVFTNVLLADEINRANPKTQSALLEAMHDAHVSHDGQTDPLPWPFFVIATQNSLDNHGTFPLPESQLDRFLLRFSLGYPGVAHEKLVFSGNYQKKIQPGARLPLEKLKALQEAAQAVFFSEELLDYLWRLVQATREHAQIRIGVSPRGGQALYRVCQSLALIRGRNFVIPDDLKELVPFVFPHRITLKSSPLEFDNHRNAEALVLELLNSVKAPI